MALYSFRALVASKLRVLICEQGGHICGSLVFFVDHLISFFGENSLLRWWTTRISEDLISVMLRR